LCLVTFNAWLLAAGESRPPSTAKGPSRGSRLLQSTICSARLLVTAGHQPLPLRGSTAICSSIHGERRTVAHGEGHGHMGARDLARGTTARGRGISRGSEGRPHRGEGSREGERAIGGVRFPARSEVSFCVRGADRGIATQEADRNETIVSPRRSLAFSLFI